MKKTAEILMFALFGGVFISANAATVAHYDLDADATDSVGTNNGTVEGPVTFGTAGAKNYSNTAADFTGGNPSNIDVPFTPALNPAGDWTLTAWVKPDDIGGGFRSIVTSRDDDPGGNTTRGYILYQNGSSLQYWSADGGVGRNWETLVHPNVLVPNQWVHVALAYDADGGGATGRKTFFVNAQQVGFQNVNVSPNAVEAFHIGSGSDDGNSFFFNGQIDDVQFHDVALGTIALARLTAIPLPEPSTAFTLVLGGCILGFYRRLHRESAARKFAKNLPG